VDAARRHAPVLLGEVLDLLEPERGGLFVDCTLGMGGHAEALLDASDDVRLIGLDRDAESLALASRRLSRFGDRFRAIHADYRGIGDLLAEHAPGETLAGALADLGVSSHQLDEAGRGFSFSRDAELDMRMDRSTGRTAAELVNALDETELANIIYMYGEERRSRRIARAIVRARERAPIATTAELAEIVARASGIPRHKQRIHPATRTFQALRIAVNEELDELDRFLGDAVDALSSPGGRLAVISFHSLEDRIVKQTFKALSGHCSCPPGLPVCACGATKRVRILTRRPIVPGDDEIAANPRARSAKLRAVERV
jgi:16S rRNA (cytosine1402-N4)-methyltransferase